MLQSDDGNDQNITLQSFDSYTSRVTNDEPVEISPIDLPKKINIGKQQSMHPKEKPVDEI